jgi:acetyl-CoA C-acetyltransferase
MAAGLIVCSAEAAARAGVPRDRWVFMHAGAQAYDEWFVSERPSLTRSPAIRAVGRAALEHAGMGIDDIGHIDLYSCFPSAVQVAARELGLDLDDGRTPTVTGGLTFAGGPGNNYTTHAVATLVHRLRDDPDGYGLATANGWYITKHAVGVYSARPPRRAFASLHPQPDQPPPLRALEHHTGEGTVEAYTVLHARDGAPEASIISALTPAGDRALFRCTDPDVIRSVTEVDPLGRTVAICY